MKIAVLGTGSVGRTISIKLNELGHEVTIGTRTIVDTMNRELSEGITLNNWFTEHSTIKLETFKEACSHARIIFNCTGGLVSLAVLDSIGKEELSGKILIDVANPLDFSNGMPPTLSVSNSDSLAEQIQRSYPELHVVKALNTMTAGLMINPGLLSGDHNVFICGDDEHSKVIVSDLLMSFGWQKDAIIDLGDITAARGTEMILPIWLRLWSKLGTAEFNFHIQQN